ncbi:MAG: hypothetical protein ABIT05_03465 [Chitinophagaceae bacterium]
MRIINLYLIFILYCFFSAPVAAQETKQVYPDKLPAVNIRTSLSSWAEFDAGLMLGINYRWHKNFSASFEPTLIFFTPFSDEGGKVSPSGIKIRSDLRYHFARKRKKSPETFLAPEFHYKYTKTRREGLFGINCQNGQCAYFQEAVYSQLKNEVGALLKAGIIFPMGFISKKERLFLELYFGLGVKGLKFRETDIPPGGSFVHSPNRSPLNFRNSWGRDHYNVPMMPLGLKLLFSL